MKIVIIGLGGVGSILAEKVCRFINYGGFEEPEILLVDGDQYEPKNYERQEFIKIGNKADVKADELEVKFRNIDFDAFQEYINEKNIDSVIQNGNVVFICVDNHKSRMVINNYCRNLSDVTLISGGNELTDGHPEIANPDDKLPDEMSCEELSKSEPQLYFTNLGVATLMCWLFYNSVVNEQHDRSEVYFDIQTMNSDSKIRILK